MINTTELRRLHAESSGGEWKAVENSCYCEIRHDGGKEYFEQIGDMCSSVHIGIPEGTENEHGNRALSTANATFCAAAHNAMPSLCDELDAARARIAELEDSGKTLAKWESPLVQRVYQILCDNTAPPNQEEHWEGYKARCIVAELEATMDSQKALSQELPK